MSAIKNVFVLMLENHSFDNVFGLSGISGITHATTSDVNSYNGVDYHVAGSAPSQMPTDPGHEFEDTVEQLAGQGASYPSGGPYPAIDNSGFAANYATSTTEGPAPPASKIGDVMKCFDTQSQLPVIYELATEFAICDHWFSSMPGPTWPNRFFVHGASSAGLDHSPSKAEMAAWESPISFLKFKFPNGSIYDKMDDKGVKWRAYIDHDGPMVGSIPMISAIKGINLADVYWLKSLASDLQGSYEPQYTFIEPNYGDIASTYEGGSSQHPMDGVERGEQLIKKVYEAIRTSPLWDQSMLIICYDEHGGFYDSVAPPAAVAPGDGSKTSSLNQHGFTFEQYGVRVPAVVVSPLIPKGTVSTTVYDHTSVLATVEELFGLPHLTQRDANANSLTGLASLSSPRTDCPTTLSQPAQLADGSAPAVSRDDDEPVPEDGNLPLVLAAAHSANLESASTDEQRRRIETHYQGIQTRGDARGYLSHVADKLVASQNGGSSS